MDNSNLKRFLTTLFKPGEGTCFTATPYGTSVFSVGQLLQYGVGGCKFFSINPLRSYRLDSDVATFRNFLLELDKGTQAEQMGYIEELGMPWTSCVDSGGKSLHFIISLAQDLKTEVEYREMVSRLHGAVLEADHHTKNPSRLSRIPTVIRPDTGREQKLVGLRDPVTLAELETWLSKFPVAAKPESHRTKEIIGILSARTLDFVFNGAPKGERNHRLFLAACEFYRAGFEIEQAKEYLGDASDVESWELEKTIVSAYKRAASDSKKISS